jgi:hypothetical protein
VNDGSASIRVGILSSLLLVNVACASAARVAPAGGASVPVTFKAPDDSVLDVPSGAAAVNVTGQGLDMRTTMTVPPEPSVASIHRRRDGLFWAGIIMAAAGTGLVAGGGELAGDGNPGDLGTGLGLSVTGLVLLVPGLVMYLAAGSNRIEVKPAEAPVTAESSRTGGAVTRGLLHF